MPTPKAAKLLAALKTKPETYWIKRGEKMATELGTGDTELTASKMSRMLSK